MLKSLKGLSAALFVLAGSGAFAQSAAIPAELLEVDRLRCMQGCEANASAVACKALCDCTVSQFQKRLDMDKYLGLSAQLSRNELSEENRSILDQVANYCVAELDKAGIAVGAPDEAADKGGAQ
ncbi:MAG: hypothetical protein HWE25_10860 [Alphaproteobacteria bacterium]|nr:hypothetical protein [Alphaproteobacteria bacterium]